MARRCTRCGRCGALNSVQMPLCGGCGPALVPSNAPRPVSSHDRSDVRITALVSEAFLSRLSFGLISFALPLYALKLGMSITDIGILTTLDTAVAILFKPLVGRGIDRFGYKRSLTLAIALRSIVALLLALAGAPWQLFSIRLVHGLSAALRTPSSSSLLAEYGGTKRAGAAFAWHHTATNVAGSLGKTLAGFLMALTVSNYPIIFGASFLLSALPAVVVLFFVKEPRRERTVAVPVPTASQPRSQLNWQTMLPLIGFGFLITGSAEMLSGLFPIIATHYAHLSEGETATIYLLSVVGILVAGPLFGWLSDNVSRKLVLTVRSLANTLSSVLLILFPTLYGVGAGRITDDLGKAAFRPAWGSLMTRVSDLDRRRRAQAMSWMSMGEDAGTVLGPVVAGLLWTSWGVGVALGVRVALALITEVYTVLLVRVDGQTHRRVHDFPPGMPDSLPTVLP